MREFEHALHHGVVLAQGGEIDLAHLPSEIAGDPEPEPNTGSNGHGDLRPLSLAVRAFEREYLIRVLRLAKGKKARAAELLGISRKNLWEKLRGQGIEPGEWS